MPSVVTLPTYAGPGRQTTVRFTISGTGANYIRVWCTAAPVGSALRKKIDGTKDPRNRVEVYEGDGGEDAPWRYTFDVGGVYTFAAQEYTKGTASYGGGYQYSPDAAPSETPVGVEATLTIDIGVRVTTPIGAAPDTAELVLWNWGTTIRETTIGLHGEASPAIVTSAPTSRMLAVIESSAVVSALAALVDVPTATATSTISSLVSGYVSDWNAHMQNVGSWHDANDNDNDIQAGLAVSPNAATLPDFVNEALRKMRQHFTNDAVDGGTTSGRDSENYHNVGGKKNDQTNMPIIQGVSGPGDAYIGLAELYRCFTAHMASTVVHNSADATNTLPSTTSAKLFELHKTVLGILADPDASTPSTFSSGAMVLVQQAGGQIKPLTE